MESISGNPPARGRPSSDAGQRVSDLPFAFDEIGYWSQLKLDIVEQYGAAYTKAFANFPNLKKIL